MTEAGEPAEPTGSKGRSGIRSQILWGTAGCLFAVILWAAATSGEALDNSFTGFRPQETGKELVNMIRSGTLWDQAKPSLKRTGIGLGLALGIGFPVGLAIGYLRVLHEFTQVVFQFLRMISPLAWMPVAIVLFGVGDKPVYFLVAIAAVWPIIINTAHGVGRVNPAWIKVARNLGAGELGVIRRAVLPAIIPDVLTGLRVALGIAWIVLVPAEMLGVPDGLGYYILDTRDRFNYAELTAVILVIGAIGFLSDALLRVAQHRLSWNEGQGGA